MATRVLACRLTTDEVFEPPLSDLQDVLKDPDVMVWVDLDAKGAQEQALLAEVFSFHPLVIEDAFIDSPTPKIEEHDTFLYIVAHGVDPRHSDPASLRTEEVDLFLSPAFIVTHREHVSRPIEFARERCLREGGLLGRGPAFVAHAILDCITDQYLGIMKEFDDELDELELDVVTKPEKVPLERILGLRRSLQRLRRIGKHQRQIFERLSRGELDLVPPSATPFFRDVWDHFEKVVDLVDSYRELTSSTLEAYLGVQSHRLNEVMRLLTLISTIMLPLSFIAGVYGMNFKGMPELEWDYGYPAVLVMMLGIAIGLFMLFKRKGWL